MNILKVLAKSLSSNILMYYILKSLPSRGGLLNRPPYFFIRASPYSPYTNHTHDGGSVQGSYTYRDGYTEGSRSRMPTRCLALTHSLTHSLARSYDFPRLLSEHVLSLRALMTFFAHCYMLSRGCELSKGGQMLRSGHMLIT